MSSAMNHMKRSHRSHRRHYKAGGILRRQNAANEFHRKPLLSGLWKKLFHRVNGPANAMVKEEGD